MQEVRVKVGDRVEAGPEVEIKVGNALPLRFIPVGTVVHNVELVPGKGAQLARVVPLAPIELGGLGVGASTGGDAGASRGRRGSLGRASGS